MNALPNQACVTAALATSPPPISPTLAELIARFDAQEDALMRFYAEVFNPAVDRSRDRHEQIPISLCRRCRRGAWTRHSGRLPTARR